MYVNRYGAPTYTLACGSCNSSKGNKTIEEWLGHHEWMVAS